MVLEEQKTESTAQWEVKRTPLVSVHGVHPLALGTDGGNGSCLCQDTATRMKPEEAETARWELGRGQRVFHVGKEGQGVCSFRYVL